MEQKQWKTAEGGQIEFRKVANDGQNWMQKK